MGLDAYLYREQRLGGYDTATTIYVSSVKEGEGVGSTRAIKTDQPLYLKTEVAYWRKNWLLSWWLRRDLAGEGDVLYAIGYEIERALRELKELHDAILIADKPGKNGKRVIANRIYIAKKYLDDIFVAEHSDEELLRDLESAIDQLSVVVKTHKALREDGVDEADITYTYEESW